MTEAAFRIGGELLLPFVDPASRTYAPLLALAAVIAVLFHRYQGAQGGWKTALGLHLWRHKSSILDFQLFLARRLLTMAGLLPVVGGAWWIATRLSITLDRTIGPPESIAAPAWLLTVGYTLVLFVVWDLSRFLLHLAMHKVPALWQFHQVHHSGEVLTPMTFHRIHPVEGILYGIRGSLTTGLMAGLAYWLFRGAAVEFTVLGVHGLGLAFNAFTGNLRHSHVWMRFPEPVERWLLSPAQHQVHHALDAEYHDANFGTWLACWDRVLGTLKPAPAAPVTDLGLAEANHDPHHLFSALIHPLAASAKHLRPSRVAAAAAVAALALMARPALAEEDASDDGSDADIAGATIIVTADRGVPRVAGSAHVVTEAELEVYEHTDIHQILAVVPGVYLRGEDGFGLRPNIGLRGGNSDRSAKLMLMEDGVPLAPAPYAAPAAYYFPMPSRLIGVEVVKGAAAIRYGPQTIGGAINLLTRRVPVDETVAQADVAYGAFQTQKVHGYAGHGTDRWGVLAEAAHMATDGFKELDGGGPTGFERQDAMVKARVGTDPTADVFSEVEVKVGYGRERSDETYVGLTQTDFDANPDRRYAGSGTDRMEWTRQQASLTWRLLLGEAVDVRTVAYHHSLDRAWAKVNSVGDLGRKYDIHQLLSEDELDAGAAAALGVLRGEYTSADTGVWVNKGTNDRQLKNTGVQSVAHWRSQVGALQNELELGVRWHADDVVRTHTEHPWDMVDGRVVKREGVATETVLDSHNAAQALAIHVSDDLGVGPVRVLPGVRHEIITTRTGSTATGPDDPQTHRVWLPGLGVFYKVSDSLGLLASANQGFSPIPPGSAEDAEPETAWNYEAGTRFQSETTHFELLGFLSKYTNLAAVATLSSGSSLELLDQQLDAGRAQVRGAEVSVGQDVELGRGWALNVDGTYAFTDARFESTFESQFSQFGDVEAADLLPYVPRHQGAGAIAAVHDRWTLAAKAVGRSSMRDVAGDGEEPESNPIEGVVTVDAATEFRYNDHWASYVNGTNILGKRTVESWRPYGARPNAPRVWMVGIKATL